MDRKPSSNRSAGELAALMQFYVDGGIDCLLDEAPVDRFAASTEALASRTGPIAPPVDHSAPAGQNEARESDVPRNNGPMPQPASVRPSPPAGSTSGRGQPSVPDEAALSDAAALARSAANVDDLKASLERFDGCNLKLSAKHTVFADGNPEAPVMFVGEAPGREEDIQGLPFVGRAGQMLDLMLEAIGLDRQHAYITNMIFWRPPGNRTPTPHEIALCRPFTERHIELVDPRIVIFLGNVATRGMLETSKGILSLRGNWQDYRLGEKSWQALPTLHPAYLLRNPAHKKLAWRDFLSIRAKLDAADAI